MKDLEAGGGSFNFCFPYRNEVAAYGGGDSESAGGYSVDLGNWPGTNRRWWLAVDAGRRPIIARVGWIVYSVQCTVYSVQDTVEYGSSTAYRLQSRSSSRYFAAKSKQRRDGRLR